jgi:hypothetical protein
MHWRPLAKRQSPVTYYLVLLCFFIGLVQSKTHRTSLLLDSFAIEYTNMNSFLIIYILVLLMYLQLMFCGEAEVGNEFEAN